MNLHNYLDVENGKVVEGLLGRTDSMTPRADWRQWYPTSKWKEILTKVAPQVAALPLDNMALKDAEQVHGVAKALAWWTALQASDACSIAAWLGGDAKSDSWRHGAYDVSEPFVYLDPDRLVSTMCPSPVNIGDALLRLKATSPQAHGWVVAKAEAKALKKYVNVTANATQAQQKQIKAAADGVKAAAKVVGDVFGAAGDVVGAGVDTAKAGGKVAAAGGDAIAFASRNIWWIVGILGTGWVYYQYKSAKREVGQ